jgi:tRNA A37 threonylcarbamoyladenosine biosynthesis protein TsaE
LLNVPKGLHFGIDYYSYQVTDNFMGFKEIPKGIHYFHYSLQENSPNISFFEFFQEGEVKVYEWNQKEEDFQNLSKDSELEIIYSKKFDIFKI